MPTKEEADKARYNGSDLSVTVSGKCIVCNKGGYGDVHIIKIPEMVEMCIRCGKLYKDNNKYTGKEGGRAVYRIGVGFIPQ